MSGLTASGPSGWGQCDELHLFKGYRVSQFVSSVVRKQFDGPLPLGDGGVEVLLLVKWTDSSSSSVLS